MALINNIYVLVENEALGNEVETVSHPTETGFPVSSSIRKQPITIKLTGVIASVGNLAEKDVVAKIKALQNTGSLITYVGQAGAYNNYQIQSFNENYTNKGVTFDMSLKQIKTAKSAYVAQSSTSSKVTSTSKKFSVGDKVKFIGGYVYQSSDATKYSVKRGASTCLLTKISSLPNAAHKYHLTSTDCKYGSSNYVYGWVDADKVQAISTKTSTTLTLGGTQQVVTNKVNNPIYHTVKKGDTIYKLVNVTYKGKNNGKNFSVSKTINKNPSAFMIKGMPTTLKIGARIRMY